MSETSSSPVLYPAAQEQQQPILPPPQSQGQTNATTVQTQPQQRVHVIKKNIYLMASNPGNSGSSGGGSNTGPMVNLISLFFHFNLLRRFCLVMIINKEKNHRNIFDSVCLFFF